MNEKDDLLVLTSSGLLAFLGQLEELKDVPIDIMELADRLNVSIGDTTYTLECQPQSEIVVDDEVVEEIDDINEEGYAEFDEYIDSEEIEGGIIKELVKTLAIGGLVRLTKNAITNS